MAVVTEGISLAAAVVSAGAAAIGALVTVSQWRTSRPSRPARESASVQIRESSESPSSSGTARRVPSGAVPRSRDRLKRWAISVAILGTVVCAAFSLGAFVYYGRHIETNNVVISLLIVSSFSAVLIVIVALPVLVTALIRRRIADARTTTVGLLLALLPWGLTFLLET
jgi:hypothetical protein